MHSLLSDFVLNTKKLESNIDDETGCSSVLESTIFKSFKIMTRNSGVKRLNEDISANCYPLYFDLKCHTL